MLILGRKENEMISIFYKDKLIVEITVTEIDRNHIRLGFDATLDFLIVRTELLEQETTETPN